MRTIDERLIDIARRKERLIARAEAQRVVIAASIDGMRGAVRIVDKGLQVGRFLRAHPLLVGAALAAAMVFRGRGLVSLAGRGLAAWRVWRSLAGLAAFLNR